MTIGSRRREVPSVGAWMCGLVLATTLPMAAGFMLVRWGLRYGFAPQTVSIQPNPPQGDRVSAGQWMRVVQPQGLWVRAQPEADSPVVATAAHQQVVERLAVSPDRQWEQVRLPDQQVIGWVRAGNLQPLIPPPNLWVTARDGLMLRQDPSTSAPVVTGLAYGQELRLLTYNADRTWAQVQVPATGTVGWVKAEYTNPTPPTEREGRQVQVHASTGLLLRDSPDGTPLTTLPNREILLVLDASADQQWLKVLVVRTRQKGWVKRDYTQPL